MYWKDFKSYNLTKKMTVLGITENAKIDLTEQQHLFLNNQRCYGDMILKIGEGRWKGSNYESENLELGTQTRCEMYLKRLTIYLSQKILSTE